MEYLIKEGAHKTAWNYSLLKAVDLAAINNHQEIVQRLLEKDSSAEAQKALKAIKVRPLVLLNRLIIAPALFLVYLILLPIGAVIDVIDPAVLLVMLVMLVSALIANKVKGDVSVFRGKPVENNKLNTRTHQLKVKDEGENVDLKPNVSVDTIPTSLKAHKPS